MKQKILFLYLKTGNGHLSCAKALANSMHEQFNIESVMVDGLTASPAYAKVIVEGGYSFAQKNAQELFEWTYALNKIPAVSKGTTSLFFNAVERYLKIKIKKEKPDKIVIMHGLLIKPAHEIIKNQKKPIPTYVVVTDPFTPPPLWFTDQQLPSQYIMFSEKAKQYARTKGVPAKRIHVFPYLLHKKFLTPMNQQQLQKTKKRFSINQKFVLILSGGDSLPRGETVLRQLFKNVKAQFVVVAGRDKGLKKNAIQLAKKYDVSCKVYGFVNFVYELVNCADVVITKGGPATILEILALKKVPIVTTYLWEQEKGNVQYIEEKGVGVYQKDLRRLPSLVHAVLTYTPLKKLLQNNIKRLSIKSGTDEVARFIINHKV